LYVRIRLAIVSDWLGAPLMDEILRCSARTQAGLIRRRGISSVELVQAHLDQIARVNPEIHAAVAVLGEPALEGARQADDAVRRGTASGALHGVPFSTKDSIELEGVRCTAGTWGRREAPPALEDATVVARLRAAGAIPIAKTNLPDLLFAFESDNLLFGATNNPYDLTRTSGGSSGGEAALIAACGSPCGLGSDAAGSVRVPAAFCGIASIKPTSGRLPRTGHVPPSGGWIEALWQIGPMARRVEDLCLMMRLLAGSDGRDYTVRDVSFQNPEEVNLQSLRLAFYTGSTMAAPRDEVAAVVRGAAKTLADDVECVEEEPLPGLDRAYDLEMKLIGPDGGDSLRGYLASIGSARLHPLLSGWLDKLEPYRTNLQGFVRYWAEWDSWRGEAADYLRRYDAILCPAYTQPALPHGASILDENFRGFTHTMAFNVLGWPAAVVRCGESAAGLPIAVQVVAPPYREDAALAVALRLESAFGGWKPPSSLA
jgi:amidase